MRTPNHLILDFEYSFSKNSSKYWALSFLELRTDVPEFLSNVNVNKKFITKNPYTRTWAKPNKLLTSQESSTLRFSSTHSAFFAKKTTKEAVLRTHKLTPTLSTSDARKNILRYSRFSQQDNYFYLELEPYKYSQRNLRGTFIRYWGAECVGTSYRSRINTALSLFNLNFLRRERLYTKLKYSRTPAYDIVSGGSAALLAGFIGFLVSEKFGFELVDSGDFYFFFMYMVFIAFSIRPLLWAADPEKGFIDLLSPWRAYEYYSTLIYLLLEKLPRNRH